MQRTIFFRFFGLAVLGVLLAIGVGAYPAQADGPVVVTQKSSSWVEGNTAIVPASGKGGVGLKANWQPYFVPGQSAPKNDVEGDPYYLAYANTNQPVQSTDWWSGVGMQWKGWVDGADPANPVIRTRAFISEPFTYQFVDLPDSKTVPGLGLPVQGLRLWNAVDMRVITDNPDSINIFGRGDVADQRSPIVTVGLKGVHPISDNVPDVSQKPPWTNVLIQKYTDWGVEMSYATGGNEMWITMANGSPFTWFQRTKGDAPFRVWAGTDDADPQGNMRVWYNQDGVLGLVVTNEYVAPGPDLQPRLTSTAAYAIFADQGDWKEQKSTNSAAKMSLFTNNSASRLVVAALPHNLKFNNDDSLKAALAYFQPFAWQRIVGTQIHYNPIEGSQKTVRIGGKNRPLGYDDSQSVVRSMNAVTTEYFKNENGSAGASLQVIFPHHYKTIIAQDQANIPKVDGNPRYTWRSIKGELWAYTGNTYVREVKTYGVIPYLPSIAINSTTPINGKLPAEDIYDTLKTWFYVGEPHLPPNKVAPFIRDLQRYWGPDGNTYSPEVAGLFENIFIADQLARSKTLYAVDPDRGKQKNAVAAEMRNEMLDGLKEILSRWQDVYTTGFFQYNPDFSTIYGFPEGYGSVQNLNDKHFHWSYFLRAAAVVGRYDSEWLQAHLPLFQELVADVAKYSRQGNRYPFMRNYSPFYGHSWANGVGNGGTGNDQESTSEAIHFAVAMIELGQVADIKDWRDIGLWLYEEQVLSTEQYWFNQDANLDASSGTFYNGNWPDAFVRYSLNSVPHISPVIGQVFQSYAGRSTFFGSPGFNPFVNAFIIQAVPLSSSTLYVGRDPVWLGRFWQEFVLENNEHPGLTAYENVVASLQARLPGTGNTVNDPGLQGALARINREHIIYTAANNAQAKNWAYALDALGELETGIVADIATYAVFCKGGSTPGDCSSGGTRTFVAYNPSSTQITVTFKNANTLKNRTTMDVPPYTLATRVGGSGTPMYDRSSTPNHKNLRLYLRKPAGFSSTCDALQQNSVLPLQREAGTWILPEGQVPFPRDNSAFDESIVCVPARPDNGTPNVPPASPYVRAWSGKFSGKLVQNDVNPHTRFALYTNQSFKVPGWQRFPCVAGGAGLPKDCQNANINGGANAISFRVSYDFNSDGTADRIESYENSGLNVGNAFLYGNKQTEYLFNVVYPNSPPPMNLIKNGAFPANIDSNNPATITVIIYGGSVFGAPESHFPIPVSVNASPLTDRASWVLPPYGESE